MGCPDWPKCFGHWIPPTSVEQLPENYKEVYSAYRDEKNQKFARYLSLVGLNETADKIREDKAIRQEADFNPIKTWVEYINRLVGVAIGGFIILLFWSSLKFRETIPRLFLYSTITLVAVIIQGWFGSIVVSTNLTTWTITIHMLVALLIVALLVYLYHKSNHGVVAKGERSGFGENSRTGSTGPIAASSCPGARCRPACRRHPA